MAKRKSYKSAKTYQSKVRSTRSLFRLFGLTPRRLVMLIIFLLSLTGVYSVGKGRVVSVSDGDTITVLNEQGGLEKIRLYGIDCPESSQVGGRDATNFTKSMVLLKEVDVTPINKDRYGRTVAVIKVKGHSTTLNEELLRSGNAWYYRSYCSEAWCKAWRLIEIQAQANKVGLWRDPKAEAPWTWRKNNK